jgi:hypothetical protein
MPGKKMGAVVGCVEEVVVIACKLIDESACLDVVKGLDELVLLARG